MSRQRIEGTKYFYHSNVYNSQEVLVLGLSPIEYPQETKSAPFVCAKALKKKRNDSNGIIFIFLN